MALEEPYELGGNRKDIDIQVSILGKDHDELYRLIIENKVKPQSGSENQLSQYYQAILEDEGVSKI